MSLAMSIIANVVLILMVVATVGVYDSSFDTQSPIAYIISLTAIGMLFINLAAFCIGIIGLFQKERSRLYALLGTILSFIPIGGVLVTIILALG